MSDEKHKDNTSFYHRAPSPCIDVTSFEHDLVYTPVHLRKSLKSEEVCNNDLLLVNKKNNNFKSDSELSDRFAFSVTLFILCFILYSRNYI